jgi:hypothetical protein
MGGRNEEIAFSGKTRRQFIAAQSHGVTLSNTDRYP